MIKKDFKKKEGDQYLGGISYHIGRVSNYIDNMLKKGYNEKDIKKTLLSAGWPEELIDDELSKIEGRTKRKPNLFASILFMFIVSIFIGFLTRFVFKPIPKVTPLGYFSFYTIFGLLLLVLIIILLRLFVTITRSVKRDKVGEKVGGLLKRKKKIKKEKKKEKKPNIFLRMFKGGYKEEKEGIKLKKEKIVAIKSEEKKEIPKKIKIERKKLEVFYFVLFLLSIIIAVIAYLYRSPIIGGVALILVFVSIFGFRKVKKSKEKIKEERIRLVKELSKAKIELGRYETDLDALYKLVEEKGRIRLSAISKYFGVDKKLVEEWATILEEHNIVKIHYPAFGGPEVRKVNKEEG